MNGQNKVGIDTSICDEDARAYIEALLTMLGTSTPSVEQIWAAMDFAWDVCGADNQNPAPDSLARFYSHPVWLLNGLFIEQHIESIENRKIFADWISSLSPDRVADFGGGYGTLARMIAHQRREAQVEIVDPFPRSEAIRACEGISNLTFKKVLKGQYDVIVATDVFEHVTDPVGLAAEVAGFVASSGIFLTANHFAPSIKCHLPSTFHLNLSWDYVLRKLGFERECTVGYGTAYRRISTVIDIHGARRVEGISRELDRLSVVRRNWRVKRYLMALLSRLS